nr:CRISPR system precrRNA processing endoribonuclease RAMP protein Cas6 [Scopulibacillus daqui]
MYSVGEEGLYLPAYKGSTFRGVFGMALKEVACNCPKGSGHEPYCIYAYLFETALSNTEANHLPRPFILEPPNNEEEYYPPGERIWLGFTLLGGAIQYLPIIIYTLKLLGEKGFGKGKHSAKLVQVFSLNLSGSMESIYKIDSPTICNHFSIYTGSEIIEHFLNKNHKINQCTLHFVTPTRLKYNGQYTDYPEFHIVLRSIVRRITSLYYVHHNGEKQSENWALLFETAENIKLIKSAVRWYDWERYSNRQHQRMKMGGIVGQATYVGDLQLFIPWLILGEYVNLGKNATFGLGKIKIILKH